MICYHVINKMEWDGESYTLIPIGYTTSDTERDLVNSNFDENFDDFLSKTQTIIYESRHKTTSIEGFGLNEILDVTSLW